MLEIKKMNLGIENLQILEEANFSLDKNQVVILVGKNGIGKTTLLQAILGLKPSTGDITIDGTKLGSMEAKRKISYMPTNFISDRERIKPFLKHMAYLSEIDETKQIDSLLRKFNLYKKRNRRLSKLSSGEMKKVLFIQLLLTKADYFVLDEPIANLDLQTKVIIMDILQKMKEDKGILIITHNLAEWKNVLDRVITIKNKKIVELDTKNKKITLKQMLVWLGIKND